MHAEATVACHLLLLVHIHLVPLNSALPPPQNQDLLMHTCPMSHNSSGRCNDADNPVDHFDLAVVGLLQKLKDFQVVPLDKEVFSLVKPH